MFGAPSVVSADGCPPAAGAPGPLGVGGALWSSGRVRLTLTLGLGIGRRVAGDERWRPDVAHGGGALAAPRAVPLPLTGPSRPQRALGRPRFCVSVGSPHRCSHVCECVARPVFFGFGSYFKPDSLGVGYSFRADYSSIVQPSDPFLLLHFCGLVSLVFSRTSWGSATSLFLLRRVLLRLRLLAHPGGHLGGGLLLPLLPLVHLATLSRLAVPPHYLRLLSIVLHPCARSAFFGCSFIVLHCVLFGYFYIFGPGGRPRSPF